MSFKPVNSGSVAFPDASGFFACISATATYRLPMVRAFSASAVASATISSRKSNPSDKAWIALSSPIWASNVDSALRAVVRFEDSILHCHNSVTIDSSDAIVFAHDRVAGLIDALERDRRAAKTAAINRGLYVFSYKFELLAYRSTELISLCHEIARHCLDTSKGSGSVGLGCIVSICADLNWWRSRASREQQRDGKHEKPVTFHDAHPLYWNAGATVYLMGFLR